MYKQVFVPVADSGDPITIRPENFGADPKMADAWTRVEKVMAEKLSNYEVVGFEKVYNFFDHRLYGFTIYCRLLEEEV